MPVFVVVITKPSAEVARRLDELPEGNRYRLRDDVWLVDFDDTTKSFAEHLGIRKTDTGATGVAFSITNYSGRGPRSMWEWLRLHVAPEEL